MIPGFFFYKSLRGVWFGKSYATYFKILMWTETTSIKFGRLVEKMRWKLRKEFSNETKNDIITNSGLTVMGIIGASTVDGKRI